MHLPKFIEAWGRFLIAAQPMIEDVTYVRYQILLIHR